MADTLQGLFADPRLLQQAQDAQLAKMTPNERLFMMGRQTGRDIGQGLGGFFGVDVQDPAMARASKLRELGAKYGTDTAEAYRKMAAEIGDPQLAMQLNAKANEMDKLGAEIKLKQAETTAKLRESMSTEQKNAQALADSQFERGSPEWNKAYGLALNRLTAGAQQQWDVKEVGVAEGTREPVYTLRAPGQEPKQVVYRTINGEQKAVPYSGAVDRKTSSTNVSLSNTADKSYGSQFGEGVAKSDLALREAAQGAPDGLQNIEQTRQLLDSGKVFTGTGATLKLNALSFGKALGVTGATDNEIIANTQQLQQNRAKAVLSQVKSSGLGTGQGFTDKDLAFLEKSAAGNITLDAETLRRQLKAEENALRAIAARWNKRVGELPAPLQQSMGLSPTVLPTTPVSPVSSIPSSSSPGKTGNPLIDKYLQ